MPFYPGPGLGATAYPIDPFYLSWKTKQAGIEARFIELRAILTDRCRTSWWTKFKNALNDHAKPVKGSHVHILGVAYKRDIDDVRESPALDIILLLERRGAASPTAIHSFHPSSWTAASYAPKTPTECPPKADCV